LLYDYFALLGITRTLLARRDTDLRVMSSVSGYGDSVWSLAYSRTCVKLGDGLMWRVYFLFRTAPPRFGGSFF